MPLSNAFAGLSRIFKHIELYGLAGFSLWRGKLKKKEKLIGYKLKGFQHTIFLRTHTSDYETFKQIFLDKEYAYDLKFEPKNIIDCGANIGLASILFANKYPEATIIAIEPEASNFELLKLNTKEYPNIHCLRMGVWDKTVNLKIEESNIGKWGFTTKEVNYQDDTTIEAISISDIMAKFSFSEIDILKMDVEGAEAVVFQDNYENWLKRTRVIIIELHDWMKKQTAKPFFDALHPFDFALTVRGENIFCELKQDSFTNLSSQT